MSTMNTAIDVTDIKAAVADQIDAGDFFDITPWPRIAIVAGETSGDNLGASLIHSLREKFPAAEFVGIAGPQMRAAGCEAWDRSESLAVMGLGEVIPHLRRIVEKLLLLVVLRLGRCLNDLFQFHVAEFGTFDQLVKRVHIGLMMFVIMERNGSGRNGGLQRRIVPWQRSKFKRASHVKPPKRKTPGL